MARRDKSPFKDLEVISYETPSKRDLRMSRSSYQPFGNFYCHYRYHRRTWLNSFHSPWGDYQKPQLSVFLEDADSIAREIRNLETPEEIRPLVDAMASLAPALLNEENHWQQFREELQAIREHFEGAGPTSHLYPDGSGKQHRYLSWLHEMQKALPVSSPVQRGLRTILFNFARTVAGKENWRRPLNKWEHGISVAQKFEFDEFLWTKRACLIHARHQLVCLGRALGPIEGDETFNRTRIRNRASIIYELAHLKGKDRSFAAIKERIKKSRQEGHWEAYLNKLPARAFPKKRCA